MALKLQIYRFLIKIFVYIKHVDVLFVIIL